MEESPEVFLDYSLDKFLEKLGKSLEYLNSLDESMEKSLDESSEEFMD